MLYPYRAQQQGREDSVDKMCSTQYQLLLPQLPTEVCWSIRPSRTQRAFVCLCVRVFVVHYVELFVPMFMLRFTQRNPAALLPSLPTKKNPETGSVAITVPFVLVQAGLPVSEQRASVCMCHAKSASFWCTAEN